MAEIAPLPSGSLIEAMRKSTDYRIHEITGTRVHASMVLHEGHHQPFGIVHGGVYAFAVEGVASLGATAAVEDQGMFAVGMHNSTDFLRSMRTGRVDIVATALHQGRTQQLWQVDITRESDGKRVARGQLRLQNLPLPA